MKNRSLISEVENISIVNASVVQIYRGKAAGVRWLSSRIRQTFVFERHALISSWRHDPIPIIPYSRASLWIQDDLVSFTKKTVHYIFALTRNCSIAVLLKGVPHLEMPDNIRPALLQFTVVGRDELLGHHEDRHKTLQVHGPTVRNLRAPVLHFCPVTIK